MAFVEQLLAVNPFNPDIRPVLEKYVYRQLEYNFYNLDANLCLLRFYQHNPADWKSKFVVSILIKGLMAMPAPDFFLYLCLIPERMQNQEPLKALIELQGCLETARFHEFWIQTASNRYRLKKIPGFLEAIQAYAIHLISLTYQKVPRPVLSKAVDLQGPELNEFINRHMTESGWIVENDANKGEFIILPHNEFNHPELKKNRAGGCIPLESIARIFPRPR